jgi:hypothetical protein
MMNISWPQLIIPAVIGVARKQAQSTQSPDLIVCTASLDVINLLLYAAAYFTTISFCMEGIYLYRLSPFSRGVKSACFSGCNDRRFADHSAIGWRLIIIWGFF